MNSLIEVDMTTIREAALHFKRCKVAGQAIIDRLKKQKTTVKTWVFFKKEISVWEYLGTIEGWHGRGHYAALAGFATEEEGRLINLASKGYDYDQYAKHGRRVFLTPSDYRSLIWIMETKID